MGWNSLIANVLFAVTVLAIATPGLGYSKPNVPRWNREHIAWVPWADAIATATREDKPIMMVIHKTWCPACLMLGEDVQNSAEIELLSEYFVMADVEDDDEPPDKKYAIQGQYNPRILFLYPNGDVADIINETGEPQHLHFYPDVPSLVQSMLRALRVIKRIDDIDEL